MYKKIPNPKGLQFAKDTLAQLKYQKVQSGRYIETTKKIRQLGNKAPDDSAKKHIASLKQCAVCAKGALLLHYVEKYNKIPLDRVIDACSSDICDILSPFFSTDQLHLIEQAFEGWSPEQLIVVHPDLPEYDFTNFALSVPNAKQRLKIILENIIANGGIFVPAQILAHLIEDTNE